MQRFRDLVVRLVHGKAGDFADDARGIYRWTFLKLARREMGQTES